MDVGPMIMNRGYFFSTGFLSAVLRTGVSGRLVGLLLASIPAKPQKGVAFQESRHQEWFLGLSGWIQAFLETPLFWGERHSPSLSGVLQRWSCLETHSVHLRAFSIH